MAAGTVACNHGSYKVIFIASKIIWTTNSAIMRSFCEGEKVLAVENCCIFFKSFTAGAVRCNILEMKLVMEVV
jgi:hypothetical protein